MGVLDELTTGLPRQGPGSNEATRRALAMTRELPMRPRILDVGCGPGMQTIELARATGGEIVAVDVRQRYLDELMHHAGEAGVAAQITPVKASMAELEFPDLSFDLIWSEGAIYIMGFERGLREWRRFLKSGGWIAVSELTWIAADPPEAPKRYWAANYPAMKSRPDNLAVIRDTGYTEVDSFILPVSAWWENYYGPAEERARALPTKYADDPEGVALLRKWIDEFDLFRGYSDFYGYVFYVMRKPR